MDKYAFLLLAMSVEEAKAALGFPPNATPSETEVRKALRQRVLEVHPDRGNGGTEEDIKELNAAQDILLGKKKPTYSRTPNDPSPSAQQSWNPAHVNVEPPKKQEITFEQAAEKAGIPSGVEWLFTTERQRGTSYSSDEFQRSEGGFVAYGRKGDQHVFVGARHVYKQDMFIGATDYYDIWELKSTEIPVRDEVKESQNPAWLYGHVVQALHGVGMKVRFNSKVLDAKGWKLSDKLPSGSSTSIKHWLVGSGTVAGDAPAVANRKQVVEMTFGKDWNPKPGYVKPPSSYSTDYYKVGLVLNGRAYDLSEEDITKFLKLRIGGKSSLDFVFGDYYYGGEKKQITRMSKGKALLTWLVENLKSLPTEAVGVLQAAVAQMKG